MSKQICILGKADQAHYVLEVMAPELERDDIVYITAAEENLAGRYFDYVYYLQPLGDWTLKAMLKHGTTVTPVHIQKNGEPYDETEQSR